MPETPNTDPTSPAAEIEQAAAGVLPAEEESTDPRVTKANGEAASYRRKLREAEGERDNLAARVERFERRDIEAAVLAAGMHEPADFWATVPDLSELRDDDGEIDADKVGSHLEELRASRGHYFAPRSNGWPNAPQGPRGDSRPQVEVGFEAGVKRALGRK